MSSGIMNSVFAHEEAEFTCGPGWGLQPAPRAICVKWPCFGMVRGGDLGVEACMTPDPDLHLLAFAVLPSCLSFQEPLFM